MPGLRAHARVLPGPFVLLSQKGWGVVVCLTDRVRVPGGLSRKSMRHWEGRSGFPVSLLPRALSWVILGAGAGLELTPGSRVAVSAPV